LRKAALIEGTTLILLIFIAVPLKRIMETPEMVSIIGITFLAYIFILVQYYSTHKTLTSGQLGIGMTAAIIPLGSFIFDHKVLKKTNT